MDIELVRRIVLARHLFRLANESLRSGNEFQIFASVNLMQDALEAFLVGLADHVGAKVDQNTKFNQLMDAIDAAASKALPFRARMLRLNRVRVEAKHHGIQPSREECERFRIALREFFDTVTSDWLGANFETVSAIDLLGLSESKEFLIEAQACMDKRDYAGACMACRKALYLEIEQQYSVEIFQVDGFSGFGAATLSSAPEYAQSLQYVRSSVRDPTEYIVLDHASVDRTLLRAGVDPDQFWNVLRLTPRLFRRGDGSWAVAETFVKLKEIESQEVAEYVFAAAVEVVLSLDRGRNREREAKPAAFTVALRPGAIRVYVKADVGSAFVEVGPDARQVHAIGRVSALNGSATFWHILSYGPGRPVAGYVRSEDIDSGTLRQLGRDEVPWTSPRISEERA